MADQALIAFGDAVFPQPAGFSPRTFVLSGEGAGELRLVRAAERVSADQLEGHMEANLAALKMDHPGVAVIRQEVREEQGRVVGLVELRTATGGEEIVAQVQAFIPRADHMVVLIGTAPDEEREAMLRAVDGVLAGIAFGGE
jgi:hypothetical protein